MKIKKMKWANYTDTNSKEYKKIATQMGSDHWSRQFEYSFAVLEAHSFLDAKKPSAVTLDAGAAGSPLLPYLFKNYGTKGIAVDLNPLCSNNDMLITAHQASITSMPFLPDQSIDLLLCISVLEHLDKNIPDTVKEFERVLKNDGKIILTLDVTKSDASPFSFKPSELIQFINLFESDIQDKESVYKPKEIMSSDDSDHGRMAGAGLYVLGMVLEK